MAYYVFRMFTQDTLYRLRIGIRAVVSYMMSILCDPFREWESQMDANFHLTSSLDLTRTLAEFQLVAHHAQRLVQQIQRASTLISTGENVFLARNPLPPVYNINFKSYYDARYTFHLFNIIAQPQTCSSNSSSLFLHVQVRNRINN